MKYLLIILILFSASLRAQTKDTLVLKTKYTAIVLGDKVFNVKVSLEEAPAAPVTTSKPLAGRKPYNDGYVQKNDFDAKMKDIDSKITKTNASISALQNKIPKSDTIKFSGTDFIISNGTLGIKR